MDFGEIEFTEWQIEKIRVALNYYRIANARNGRLPSWNQVCDDIIYSDVNIDRYSEDDAELAFKPEALRRFAARITVLGLERLRDVTRFLIHEKLIDTGHLKESNSNLREMLAAHQYLATKSEGAKEFIRSTEGTYTAKSSNFAEMYETFTLKILPDASNDFVHIEEIYEVSSGDFSEKETRQEREAHTILRIIRTGYGFAVTENMIVHIFLGGEWPITQVSYVQVMPYIDPNGGICLLRSGPRNFPVRSYELASNGAICLYNAFQFSPSQTASE